MKLLLICILLTGQVVIAQEVLTIVPVGKAEQEKEKLYFKLENSITDKFKLNVETVIKVIKEDFAFYRSRFETIESSSNEKFQILVNAKKNEMNYEFFVSIKNTKDKSELGSFAKSYTEFIDRKIAHEISFETYKLITGKEPIFNSKIVFVSDRTSISGKIRKELYIMDFDGENKKRLTFKNSIIISPAISPNNKDIVFTLVDQVSRRNKAGTLMKTKNLNLYKMTLGSRNLSLVSGVRGINSGATFNSTGDSIFLTLSLNGNADIYKVDLKTKKRRRITKNIMEDVDPHVNKNENLMAFLSNRPGKAMIYTLDPTGLESKVKRISFVGDFNAAPRFNPEGTEIVFSSWVDNRFDLFRINSDGTNLVRLTKNFGSNEEPWYSPDGEFIIFTSQRVLSRSSADQDMYIMDRNGEIIKKVSSKFGKVFTPRWSN